MCVELSLDTRRVPIGPTAEGLAESNRVKQSQTQEDEVAALKTTLRERFSP